MSVGLLAGDGTGGPQRDVMPEPLLKTAPQHVEGVPHRRVTDLRQQLLDRPQLLRIAVRERPSQ